MPEPGAGTIISSASVQTVTIATKPPSRGTQGIVKIQATENTADAPAGIRPRGGRSRAVPAERPGPFSLYGGRPGLTPDALLADQLDGMPLPLEHGGSVRMMIPTLYAWKSSKFLRALEFSIRDKPGYWEVRGYHNNADPWKEGRNGEPPSDDGFADAAKES